MIQDLWDRVYEANPYGDAGLWIAGMLLVHAGVHFAYQSGIWVMELLGLGQQYLIPRAKHQLPTFALQVKCVIETSIMVSCVIPVLAYYSLPLFYKLDFSQQLPTIWQFLQGFALCYICDETIFYWVHRVLHHPKLYKHMHKKHHEFVATMAMSSMYAHPIEVLIGILLPSMGAALLFKMHFVTLMAWLLFHSFEKAESHAGYVFPIQSCYRNVSKRDHHHVESRGCYGSMFMIWDKVMGTDALYLRSSHAKL
eukprot:TRINITY_DN84984_c0_g1_i1.p1 TRINITY_DN84984_c0_g1~~TRINITY_DN84984_c0_g1_i1.p1  ORF type:complete len:253 (-),score=21.30 TRINITY_DN84984_c0_g1_i1:112-870(-)